jgi:uncharacterized protein YaaW (UPF0174 family)
VLFCLSSGAPAPEKIETGLFDAYRNRLEAHKKLAQERLVDKIVIFNAPLKKQNLKTFADTKKFKKVNQSRRNNLVEVKAAGNVFGQLLMLSEKNDIILEKTLTYPLGPVTWSLATANVLPTRLTRQI